MKTVLVTGITGGIGFAIASKLIEEGYKLVVVGRNTYKLEQAIAKLGKENILYSSSFDMSDSIKIKNFVSEYQQKGITIDVLVNNAGNALGLDHFQDSDLQDATAMLDINVKAVMVLTYYVMQEMLEKNEGHIINIGSTAGQNAYAKGAVYCASKAAIKNFSDGLRLDVMSSDIKVTTVMPELVETDFSKVRFKGDEKRANLVYQGIEALQASDIADVTWYVINQPKRVQIGEITVLANQQGNGFSFHKK